MKTLMRIALSAAFGMSATAWASISDSAAGTWKTIDDETGKPASLVQITESDGVLQGKVLKVLRVGADPNEKCDKCDGDLKGQPVVGMTILDNFKRKTGEQEYDGGTVLDPHNGKTYSGKITLIENGQKLSLRGFVGITLIGRTQTWIRVQ